MPIKHSDRLIYRVTVEFPPLPHNDRPHRVVISDLTETQAKGLVTRLNLARLDGSNATAVWVNITP
jgi:hypothetical protein